MALCWPSSLLPGQRHNNCSLERIKRWRTPQASGCGCIVVWEAPDKVECKVFPRICFIIQFIPFPSLGPNSQFVSISDLQNISAQREAVIISNEMPGLFTSYSGCWDKKKLVSNPCSGSNPSNMNPPENILDVRLNN